MKDPGYWKILLRMTGMGIVPDWLIKFRFYFRFRFVSSRWCILFMVLWYLLSPPYNFSAQTEICQFIALSLHTPSLTCGILLHKSRLNTTSGLMNGRFWSLNWQNSRSVEFVLICFQFWYFREYCLL